MVKSMFLWRYLKKSVAIMLILLQLIGICLTSVTVNAATTEGNTVSRLINVVYDDSQSMIMGKSTAWSEAKYSLEILSAMMQEKDSMNVYFMSDYKDNGNKSPRITNLSGAQAQSNISKIHNTVTAASSTPFLSIKSAYNDLKSASGSYTERHLVVLTDGGEFNNNENTADLDKLFADAQTKGIKVVYLAIGEKTIKPTEKSAQGIFVYSSIPDNPSGENSILNRVTQMCERIFQRPAHPVSGKTLNLKVPVSEIVVFAQGANAKVGDIKGAKKSVSNAGLDVQKDINKATTTPDTYEIGGIGNIRVASGLTGSVATFTPTSGDYIPEGTYNLDITATSFTVYYKPCLDVNLNILDKDGNKVENGTEVDIGEYNTDYFLTYPKGHAKHGQELSLGDLGINPQYTLTIKNGTNVQKLEGPAPKTLDLAEGKTEITVTANYLTYISTATSMSLAVADLQVHELNVTVTPDKKEYMLSELEKDKEGFTVKVAPPPGEQLTAELWANAKLTLTAEGLDFFEPVKNSDYTFTVRPKRKDGDYKKTASGDIPFKAGVTIDKKGSKVLYKGTGSATVNIYNDVIPDKENGFKITVLDVTDDIKSDNFNASKPTAKIEISWNGNPLTKGQYDALKLSAIMEDDMKVKDANGKDVSLVSVSDIKLDPYKKGEKTTATISFVSNGDAETQRKNINSYDDFIITANMNLAGVKNETKAEGSLDVDRVLSTGEIILIILGILAILFFLLGYIILKKWLPFKIYYKDRRGMYKPIYPYKNVLAILTALIPFVGVSTKACLITALADKTRFTPVLHIKAHKRKKAILLNALAMYKDNRTYIDATHVKLAMQLKDAQKTNNSQSKSRTQRKRKVKPTVLNLASSRVYKNGDAVATFQGTKYRSRMK